jgi:protein SCO1/2
MIALALTTAMATAQLDEHVGARVPTELIGPTLDGHRPVVLALAYARCRMLCSVVLRGLAEAVRDTPGAGRDYLPVVVTLDPRETPAEADARQAKLLADAGLDDARDWPYLVGTDAQIHALAGALGFHYAWDPDTQQFAHPAAVFVLTPDGRVAEVLRGVTYPDLDAAVARAARGELTPDAARDTIACFHFDPALRRYQARIAWLFALGGAVVLGGVGALFLWIRRLR